MTLDIDKMFEASGDKIEQSDLERLQELGILGENIHLFDTFEQPGKSYWIKKYKCNSQTFFMFNYFFFSTSLIQKNHINLEKYLQSDEPNIILQNCNVENQKDIKGSNKINQVVIVSNSEFPNISSCEFENEVSLHNITKDNTFCGCEFAKKVYVDGYAYYHSCTFNSDFVSKNITQDISFAGSIFNKSFTLSTGKELGEAKFEAVHFKQKFNIDIQKFKVLDFSCAKFDCELNLHARQFDGININFINATFNQKLSFHRSIINCEMLFKEARFESDLIFTEAKFNDVVNLDKAKFKGKAQFRGTKFNRAILTEATFENKADFSNAVFNEKAYFTNAIFEADTDFSSTAFNDEARFFNVDFKGATIFKNVEFKGKADFKTDKNLTFGKDANFSNANFQDNAYFNNRVFEDFVDFTYAFFKMKADFMDTLFIKEARLNNIFFYNDACFRNTVFEDIVNFGETIFEKNAIFYNTDFQKYVNFLSCSFKDTLNIINAKIDFVYFTYEDFKGLIENKSKDHRNVKNIDECINTANDFRDSFRLMKHTLNNKGNALDASLFHRLELYCKELELEFTLGKDGGNSKEVKSADEIKVKPKSKNRIEILLDLITLKLYRNISDHHTNLLRIINFMVLTVAVYGFSIFMYEKIILKYLISLPYNFVYSILLVTLGVILWVTYHRIAKYNIAWINMLLVGLVMLMIILVVAISAKYTAYIALFITLYLFLYYKAITKSKYDLACLFYYGCFIAIFFIKPILIAPFIGMFTSEQIAESKFKEYTIRYNGNSLDDMLLDANLTNAKKDDKLDFIVKNRKTILDELDNDKALLNDFVEQSFRHAENFVDHNMSNKNMQKKEAPQKPYAKALVALKYDEIMQSTQKSANLLYSFIMLLVIYSLTKTARRNSVVPS